MVRALRVPTAAVVGGADRLLPSVEEAGRCELV